eukprot:GILI01016282.1.p1 GENE.GILI01016282.1~~GILI01016282.1.p1  ORF type:complete len:524 (-),score=94.12 GILI01016282.1:176-1747(-)
MGPPNKLHIYSGSTLTSTIKVSGAIERLEMTSGTADRSTQVCMLTRDQFFLIYLFNGELKYRAPTHTMNDCLSQPLCVNSSRCYVSFPSSNIGGFEVAKYSDSSNITKVCSVPKAHSHPISSICLSDDGDVCVTCSIHGTLIRVWDISDGPNQTKGVQLSELRASPIPCRIRHIGISNQGNYIFALVNSVNVCVFYIGKEEEAKAYDVSTKDPNAALVMNQSSYLSRLTFFSSFFGSKWAASSMVLPAPMLPQALIGRRNKDGSPDMRFAVNRSTAPTNASPDVPFPETNKSLTKGLMGMFWGTSQPDVASDAQPLGGGEAKPSPNTEVPTSASSSYYGGALMQSMYAAASKAVSTVATVSGVSVGGASSGVVVMSDGQGHDLDGNAVRHTPEGSSAYHGASASPPVAAKDINGRTADDVLGMWWEQQALATELSRPVVWDRADLDGFREHASKLPLQPQHKGKPSDVPAQDVKPNANGDTITPAPPSKEVLCLVNGMGELLRVEFNPIGGKLVLLPIAPAKE